jgi:hypothetical protein
MARTTHKLRVIPEPAKGHRTVIDTSSTEPAGFDDYACGSCGLILAVMNPGQ